MPQGKTLGVVGGPVTIENNSGLFAPSGTINIAAVAGVGEVPVDPRRAAATTVAHYAPVSIGGESLLNVEDATGRSSGGSIFIRGGTLAIADGGTLEASNFGDGPGGVISVRADSNIAMSNGALLNARSFAAGRGADIIMQTGPGGSIFASNTKVISGTASITSLVNGHLVKSVPTGGTGQIALTTGTVTLVNGAVIGSQVQGTGSSGPISVTANSIVLDGRETALSRLTARGIRAQMLGGADAPDITVTTGTLAIPGNGEIVTNTGAAGDAGRVSVIATGNVRIDATGAQLSTGIGSVVSPGATGNAGKVTINAGSLSLTGSADPLLPSPLIPDSLPFAGLSAQTSQLGISGTVDVIGPRVDYNGALVVLASDLRNAAEVLRDTCAAKSALPRSRLIDAGRGGLPQDVEATIPAFYLAGRAAGPGGSAMHRTDLPTVGRPPLALPDGSLHLAMHCGA